MKTLLAQFEVSKTGGIDTVRRELQKGLLSLGHTVSSCFLSMHTKDPQSDSYPTGYTKVINFKKSLSEFKSMASSSDLVIFINQCPTIAEIGDDKTWLECYKTGKPTIPIVHDPFLQKYYPHFLEAKPYITGVACIQRKGFDVISKHIDNCIITNHFLDLSPMGEYRDLKEDMVLSPNAFKTWKNNDIFIRAIPQLQNVKIEMTGIGIEYHYMSGSLEKRKEKYQNPDGSWIWDNAIAHGLNYHGLIPESDLITLYKHSKSIINLAVGELGNKLTRESTAPARQTTMFGSPEPPVAKPYRSLDYTVLFGMLYGSVPVARKHSLLDGIITESNIALVSEDDLVNSTATWINDITKNFDNYRDMIKRNHELLKTHYDNVTNTKKLLGLLK
jgi:glycosyltransferase involved in cell wall biosynthesis